MERVTLRVPERQLDDIEDLVADGIYPNRSEAVRAAIRELLASTQHVAADGGVRARRGIGGPEPEPATAETIGQAVPFLVVREGAGAEKKTHAPARQCTRERPTPACAAADAEWVARSAAALPPAWRDVCSLCQSIMNRSEHPRLRPVDDREPVAARVKIGVEE